MAAEKGNDYWKLRKRHGKEMIFKTPEALWEAAKEYFEWCDNNPLIEHALRGYEPRLVELRRPRPYTVRGFCAHHNISDGYLRSLKYRRPDFTRVVDRIRAIIYVNKFEGAAVGLFNPAIIAKELGTFERTSSKGKSENEVLWGTESPD